MGVIPKITPWAAAAFMGNKKAGKLATCIAKINATATASPDLRFINLPICEYGIDIRIIYTCGKDVHGAVTILWNLCLH